MSSPLISAGVFKWSPDVLLNAQQRFQGYNLKKVPPDTSLILDKLTKLPVRAGFVTTDLIQQEAGKCGLRFRDTLKPTDIVAVIGGKKYTAEDIRNAFTSAAESVVKNYGLMLNNVV